MENSKSFLERLLRRPPLPPPPPDTSRLSRLPLEIFLLIADQLPLESKFLLSRTCRRARFNLHRDWSPELRQMLPDERLRLLLGIAYDMPNHLACVSSQRLRKISTFDTPTHLGYACISCSAPEEYRYERNLHGHRHYGLNYNHVQLALKYTRLTNTHPKYLAKLMKPYSFHKERDLFPFYEKEGPNILSSYDYQWRETPKIVNGRFLLESVWDVRCKQGGRINWSDVAWSWSRICSDHFFTLVGNSVEPLQRARGGRLLALAHDHYDIPPSDTVIESFSCGKCRVDFQFEFSYNRWIIRSWRDLGTEHEPTRIPPEDWRLGYSAHNERCTEPHRPGPIEAMYNI